MGPSAAKIERDARPAKVIGAANLKKLEGTSLDKGTELDALVKMDKDEREEKIAHAARGAALKQLRIDEVDIPVRKLDNTTMIKIMANENMSEWSSSAQIEQETVRAIVEAYGKGEIELPAPEAKTSHSKLRNAPSFLSGEDATTATKHHPYTLETIEKFLGWKHYKVEAALNALAMIEQELAKPEDFEGLPTRANRNRWAAAGS